MGNVKKLSVIGGTGNLGASVVKFLSGMGFEIKVIARNLDKAKSIFNKNQNIRFAEADLTNVNSLRAALADTEYLYLNLSTQTTEINTSFCAEREGVANILEAVNIEKIKQIIAISGLGAFDNISKPGAFEFVPNIIRKQGHKLIKNSGIPYTLLHCSWFADSFVMFRRKNTYSVIGDAVNPIYFTNCYNYSLHLANAIGNPDAFYKEFPIQGSEGISHPAAAKAFLDIYDKTTKVSILPHGVITVLALFIKEMKYVKHMSKYFRESKEDFVAESFGTYETLGKLSMSITEYAHKLKTEKIFH
jgi:hypothetical protein